MEKSPHTIDTEMAEQLWDELEVGLAYVGLDGKWLRTNKYLCELLEYTERELEDRTFQSLTHPDDIEDDLKMIDYLKAGKITEYTISKRYITKLGKVIWIKLKVNPVQKDNETIVFFLSQIQPKHHAEFKEDFTGIVEKGFKLKEQPIVTFVKRYWWQLGAIATTLLTGLTTATLTWAQTMETIQDNSKDIDQIQSDQIEIKENISDITTSIVEIRAAVVDDNNDK